MKLVTLAKRAVWFIVLCMTLLPGFAGLPGLNSARTLRAASAPAFRIKIPAIGVDAPVITLRRTRASWSVARLTSKNAGHLQGTRLPGEGGNIVIAAHVETYALRPGPFKRLDELQVGAEILVTYGDEAYHYVVHERYHVRPTEIWPIIATSNEVLTLITCAPDDSGRPTGRYALRLIVRAVRVS